MKFIFALLIFLATVYINTVANADCGVTELVKNNFADNFFKNGGASDVANNGGVDLLTSSLQETGVSMFSKELVDVANGATITMRIKEMNSNTQFGFAMILQANNYVAMGGAGSAFSLNTLLGGVGIIFDRGTTGNAYSNTPASNRNLKLVNLAATNKNSQTLLKDGVAKSFSGSVPHSTEYTMTIKLTPAASGFMSYEATLKYGSIELKSDISKFKLTDLFPQKTAYVGATSSIGTCTSCPALRVLDFSISAVPVHKFEVDGAASRSIVASSSTENSLAYSLKADPLCGSYSFNTPSIQVRKALDTINSSQANIPNFQITTPNIGLISLVTRNYNTGTILMKYSITKVGAYQMSAIVNGQSTITPITVTVAAPSPIRSVAQYLAEPNKDISDPNFKFIAGKAETAYIHVFDAYGNAYKGDSLSTITVHHRFGCCQEVATTFSVKSSHIVPLSISTQRATEGQRTETLEFKVAGTSITGGLDQLLVDPSNPAGESSFLSGDGLTAAVVKTDAFIYLTVADLYRNVYRKASLKALVDASRIKMSVKINGVAATGTTLTEDGEKITFKYNVEKSGTYSLVCTVQETPGGVEKPCAGSQSVSIDVRPGVISHLTTDFALASTGNAIVGYPYSYFVNPMDAYSNLLKSELASDTELILTITPLAVGSALSTVSCKSTAAASRETAAKGTLVDVFCAFDPSGSYKLTFTPKLTGPTVSVLNYEIKGTIKVGADSNVMTKGATAVVNSLEAHPSTSKMTLTAQVYTHGDTPKDVTWDPETQSGIVPGTYTGTCLTNCIRAGTVLTATYKLFDKYGNLPKTDAKSVIFASASAPDAKAVVLGPVTLKGDTSTYTQTYKMETATEYNLAISISGVDFLTIKKVVISPNVFNAAQSRVEAYSMGIWYALPTSEDDKTNSWKNIYAIAPYDQFGNYIDFATAADPTAESFLIGTSQDFSIKFTPSTSVSGEVLPVTTFGAQLFTYVDTPKTVFIGDSSQDAGTEATYTIPKNRIYVEFTHKYPHTLPTLVDSTFELLHTKNAVENVIANPIKVTIIVAIQDHNAVYTYSSTAVHKTLLSAVEKVQQVFLQANDNTYSLYTTAQCTTKKDVYAMYFDNNKEYLISEPEKMVVYSSDVISSGPNPLRENKFSTSASTISSLQLVGRSVTTDPIHITLRGDGVLSLATDTQFANNKLAVNIIHGVPDLQSSSIAALYQPGKSVFVAGENNVSMMLSVADIYRNLWTNTLGAEFSVTTEIRKSGSATGEILVHDDAALVTNTIQLTRTITASGEYDFIVTLSYNHSSAPGGKFSLTFNQYTFSVVGGQLNKKSVFVSSCDDKPNVCTAGLPCTVCFTATDGYNNPVLFTNEYISKLNLGVDYTSNFNVATIGSDFTITFIPTKSGSYKPKIHMNSGTFDPSGQFDGTWTGADIIEILPSNIPGDVTVTGLTSSTPYSPTIRIKALDVYNNVFTAETSQYGLKVLPPAGTPILVSSSSMKYDKNNNEMVISGVNLEVAGEYRFELTLGSTIYPITTKVDTDEHSVVGYHSVIISPGEPYYRNTVISKTSVKDTISAGESITFKVSYYDQQRNAVVMDETMLANYPPTFDIYENMFNCNGENIVLEDTSSIKIEGEIDTPTTSEGYPIPKKSTANYSLEIIVDGDFKAFSIKAYFYRANNVPSTNLRESYYIVTSMKNSSGDVVPISTCSLARSEFALRVRPNIVFSTKTTLETDDDITETANELRLPSGSLVDVKLVFGDFYGNKFTDGLNLGTDGSAQPEVSLAETEPADGCDLSGNGFVKKVPDQDELDITYQNEHGIAIMKLETINSGVFYIGLTVSVGGGAPVYIDTCIKMDVHSGKMQRYEIAESTVRKIYHSNLSNDIAIIARDAQKNVVDPSLPALYTNFTFTITLTYAKSYTFSNGDQVGKEIVGSYTHVVVTDVISKGADYKNYDATLIHVGNVRPAWPGTYLVGCVVNDHTNSGINYAGRYDNEGFEIEFEPINCSAQDVTKPIYCQVAGELVCVDDVDKCDKVDCKDGDLTDGVCVLKKTCASGEKECNLVSNGTTLTYCVDVDSDCESESYIYGTEYRTSIGSFSYCNVDQILCTDGKTCVYDINFCPTTATCADVTCADGACVKTAEECGARVQCLDHQQYFDGSCVELPIPVYTVCEAPSAYRCFDGSCRAKSSDCPSTVVCPVGTSLCANGTCVDDISKCGIVQDCAGHMVRCPNGECALDIAFCGTKVTCPFYSPILCQDGTCADDISRCRMVESCPTGFIRCREGSCVKHLVRSDFPEPPIDETTGLPADDEYDDERILLETFKTCPIVSTCHPSVPVKCPQGHCAESRESCYDCEDVTDPSTCKKPVVCPPHLPARCGDGSCRHSKKSCPVFKSCPDHQPIRCVNDQCVLDAAHCPTELTCAPGFVLCGSGVCAPNYASCGTMLTCPVGQFRCIDGTCRAKCGLILSQNSSCAPGKIMCPNVDGGIFCATKLENCPQSIVCPAHTPIRCGDMYCAGSVEECNKINVDYIPQSRFSCGNGFWANSYSGCGTAVTCPSQAPVKCWDQSCRRVAADCPQQHGCPLDTPFLCSDGSCVLNPWSCAITQCSGGTVRCPFGTTGGAACVNNISQCVDWTNLSNSNLRCFFGQRCWDGSCTSELRYCPDRACPANMPFMCESGTCATNASKCDNLDGCPWDLPYYCGVVGTCVASRAVCDNTTPNECAEGTTLCKDGSCRPFCAVSNFGCSTSSDKTNVCADKTCVANKGDDEVIACRGPSDAINACPSSRPFRCPGGYCAVSSTRCPVMTLNDSIWSTTPQVCRNSDAMISSGDVPMTAFCDDGSCAYSLSQCPVIKPCPKGSYRCGNGLCKEAIPECSGPLGFENIACREMISRTGVWSQACPIVNTCPPSRPYRCQDGLCAVSRDQCIDDYPVVLNKCCGTAKYNSPSHDDSIGSCVADSEPCVDIARDGDENFGCPKKSTRCDNGMCVFTNGSSKFTNVQCSTYENFGQANGCAVGETRCGNGKCVLDENECPLHNGCPRTAMYRCNDGSCVADMTTCKAEETSCPQFQCPTGECAETPESCFLANGCPVTDPIRCANGTCKKFAANYFAGENVEDYCAPTNVCDSLNPFLCADGTCVPDSLHCRPILPCNEPCAIRCPGSLKCVVPEGVTAGICPDLGSDPIAAINDLCGVVSTCNPSTPILCPDGSCRSSASQCAPQVEGFCSDDTPIKCWDGHCVSSYHECLYKTFLTFNVGATKATFDDAVVDGAQICPDDLHVCPNGLCVADMTTCDMAIACPNHMSRCGDGSCASECTTPAQKCASGRHPCVDGTCREKCPMFLGCPMETPVSCSQKKVQCTVNISACPEPIRMNSDMLQDILTDEVKQEICEENCNRDVVATPQTLLISQTMSDVVLDVSTDAAGAVRTRVTIPSNSYKQDVLFSIQPVPPVFFDGGVNSKNIAAPFTMFKTEGQSQAVPGTFASTVLSTPFRCNSTDPKKPENLILPAQPMVYTASVDTTSYESKDEVATKIPCQLIGTWDAATVVKADKNTSSHPAKRCAAELKFTDDSFAIAMDSPSCDGDFAMSGVLSSAKSVSEWDTGVLEECLCFSIVQAHGGYSNIIGKDLCMNVKRASLSLSIFFEEGFRATMSGNPDVSKLGSCENVVSYPEQDYDINSYLLTPSTCSASNYASGAINKQDICFGIYSSEEQWECVRDREGRLLTPTWTEGMHSKLATATIDDCTGNAYAFIYSALPPPEPIPEEKFCWWCKYGTLILAICIPIVAIIIIALFALCIFSKNRAEYKAQQEKLNQLQDRAKELDEYAGGLGLADEDGEVVMVANPLVLKMQELQQQLDKCNVDMDTQGKQEEHEIQRLEMQRQRIKDELNRIQAELDKQNVEAAKPKRLEAAPHGGHVLSVAPGGPVSAGRAGPIGASGPVTASGTAGPTSFGAGPTGPMAAPRKAHNM